MSSMTCSASTPTPSSPTKSWRRTAVGPPPMAGRFPRLFASLQELIARHAPAEVAIEQPFLAVNVRSAMAVGEARALAVLAAGIAGVPGHQYSPAAVKQSA